MYTKVTSPCKEEVGSHYSSHSSCFPAAFGFSKSSEFFTWEFRKNVKYKLILRNMHLRYLGLFLENVLSSHPTGPTVMHITLLPSHGHVTSTIYGLISEISWTATNVSFNKFVITIFRRVMYKRIFMLINKRPVNFCDT
jgi:hypothetical protein